MRNRANHNGGLVTRAVFLVLQIAGKGELELTFAIGKGLAKKTSGSKHIWHPFCNKEMARVPLWVCKPHPKRGMYCSRNLSREAKTGFSSSKQNRCPPPRPTPAPRPTPNPHPHERVWFVVLSPRLASCQVASTDAAFAAVKADGSVVTWGKASFGGDSSKVQQARAGF